MTDDESASIRDITFPVDGIVKGLPYVDRPALRDRVIEQAKRNKALIIGAPTAMGKTSLLQMVKWKLKEDNVSVSYKRIRKKTICRKKGEASPTMKTKYRSCLRPGCYLTTPKILTGRIVMAFGKIS